MINYTWEDLKPLFSIYYIFSHNSTWLIWISFANFKKFI